MRIELTKAALLNMPNSLAVHRSSCLNEIACVWPFG